MKERPMLFSTPMVQAILDGRKTVTRRVIKPQPMPCDHISFVEAEWRNEPTAWQSFDDNPNEWYCALCGNGVDGGGNGMKCHYGQPGDILWVRETFRYCQPYGCESLNYEYKTGATGVAVDPAIHYKINDYEKWRPSIHMPKEACRLKLEILSIRVERLHDITQEDAKREGVEWVQSGWKDYTKPGVWFDAKSSFISLWTSINGQESWDSNPWVWVINFRKL